MFIPGVLRSAAGTAASAAAFCESDGTVAKRVSACRRCKYSTAEKKNVLFERTGPPIEKPNWCRSSSGVSPHAPITPGSQSGKSKAFFASSRLLRRYSKTLPWKSFVPLLSATLICAPELRPYSAE